MFTFIVPADSNSSGKEPRFLLGKFGSYGKITVKTLRKSGNIKRGDNTPKSGEINAFTAPEFSDKLVEAIWRDICVNFLIFTRRWKEINKVQVSKQFIVSQDGKIMEISFDSYNYSQKTNKNVQCVITYHRRTAQAAQ